MNFRLAALSLALATIPFSLFGCAPEEEVEYALITDTGEIDDQSYNQIAWEALRDFARENGKTYGYYRPSEDSWDARMLSIGQAVAKGAKIVLCPGYLFEEAIYSAQSQYPDVKFILLDGEPHSIDYTKYEIAENTVSIYFQEEIGGFLAGYGTVKDGKRALGFCGGSAVPAVKRYGSGFLQGANLAASELGVRAKVRYWYAGTFTASDSATAMVSSWCAGGTETVFACGGKLYQSVEEATKAKEGATWIGVDSDMSKVADNPDKVLTSSTKELNKALTTVMEAYLEDEWILIGGNLHTIGLASKLGNAEEKDYIGLPTEETSWNFESWTLQEYEEILGRLKSGEIVVENDLTEAPSVTSLDISWQSAYAG